MILLNTIISRIVQITIDIYRLNYRHRYVNYHVFWLSQEMNPLKFSQPKCHKFTIKNMPENANSTEIYNAVLNLWLK